MQESRNALIWLDDRQVGQVEVWNKAQDETGFGSASFERSTGFTGRNIQLPCAGAREPGSKMTEALPHTCSRRGGGERERLPGALWTWAAAGAPMRRGCGASPGRSHAWPNNVWNSGLD